MANYMYILCPTDKSYKTVCPECAKRGEVLKSCTTCHGSAIKNHKRTQYYLQNNPIQIVNVDRDPETGIIRYWESQSEYYYETTYNSLNKFVPDVPYGIHLCHETEASAIRERDRINEYLADADKLVKEPMADLSIAKLFNL
jgi:hypothetical protein